MLKIVHDLQVAAKSFAHFHVVGTVFRTVSFNNCVRQFLDDWRCDYVSVESLLDEEFEMVVDEVVDKINTHFEEDHFEQFLTYLKDTRNLRSIQ